MGTAGFGATRWHGRPAGEAGAGGTIGISAARLSSSGLDMTIMPYSARLNAMSRRFTDSLLATISSMRWRWRNMTRSSFATRTIRSFGLSWMGLASKFGSRKTRKGRGVCNVWLSQEVYCSGVRLS